MQKFSKMPQLIFRPDKIRENTATLVRMCREAGADVWGVTKGVSAPLEVARAFLQGGVSALADSRMLNIKRMKEGGIEGPFVLIRVPMASELEDVVDYADYSLASEVTNIRRIGEICRRKNKPHNVVLMFDMGDLREGFWPNEVKTLPEQLKKVDPLVKICGVGSNFACASAVLATDENLTALVDCGEQLEAALGVKFDIFSGGATCSLPFIENKNFPRRINNIRIGEALLMGTDTPGDRVLTYLSQDALELKAELIEVRVKPTKPVGVIGHDAFGGVPYFEDRGLRLRGIVALGRQDIVFEDLIPLDEGVSVIASSSDHMLLDLEDCPNKPKVGDILSFRMKYGAMLAASTSAYVTKVFE